MRGFQVCRFALASIVLVACTSGDGAHDDTGEDRDTDAAADTDVQDGVSFAWAPPVHLAPPDPLQRQDAVIDRCNHDGVSGGLCPTGFHCAAPVALPRGPSTLTAPRCEPDEADGAYELVLDVPAWPLDGVAVTLVMRLGGEAWPTTPTPTPGAGTIRLQRRGDGLTVELPVPVGRDRLDTTLPPGTWDVSFPPDEAPGSDGFVPRRVDTSRFPTITRTGVLEVTGPGQAVVDVDARTLPLEVTVDGEPLTVVPQFQTLDLVWVSAWNERVGFTLAEGQPLPRQIVLGPGTWSVEVRTVDDVWGEQDLPEGWGVVPDAVFVDGGTDRVLVPLRTQEVGGAVAAGGFPVPVLAHGYVSVWVVLEATDGTTVHFEPHYTTGYRLAGHVWAGAYDVWLSNGTRTGTWPNGRVRVATGVTAWPFDLDAPTVEVSGIVTANGVAPGESWARGDVVYLADDASWSTLPLAAAGDAAWSGRVWDRAAEVRLAGSGFNELPLDLPRMRATEAPRPDVRADLPTAPVEVVVQVDGADAPDGTDSGYGRAHFLLSPLDPADALDRTRLGYAWWTDPWIGGTTHGPLSTTVPLSPGDLRLGLTSASLEPAGTVDLGRIEVAPGGGTVRLDARTVTTTVELRRAGAPVTTGRLQIGDVEVDVDPSGRTPVRTWPQAFAEVRWTCGGAAGCPPELDRAHGRVIASGMALP